MTDFDPDCRGCQALARMQALHETKHVLAEAERTWDDLSARDAAILDDYESGEDRW